MTPIDDRRTLLARLSWAGAGVLLTGCSRARGAPEAMPADRNGKAGEPAKPEHEEVGAVEDLMREHGVIRRVLVVYREAAVRLRTRAGDVAPEALHRAARLIRTFGEDYHERLVEEPHVFRKLEAQNPIAETVATLVLQHRRGRELTDSIMAATERTIRPPSAEPLARTLEAFARMYEAHAAVEDTIVFPAWKKTLTAKELDAAGDLFEDIEHSAFGKDGFDDAVAEIGAIESTLGITLSSLTPPVPASAPLAPTP
jgi:hemerythrin-like domain-containing protein